MSETRWASDLTSDLTFKPIHAASLKTQVSGPRGPLATIGPSNLVCCRRFSRVTRLMGARSSAWSRQSLMLNRD